MTHKYNYKGYSYTLKRNGRCIHYEVFDEHEELVYRSYENLNSMWTEMTKSNEKNVELYYGECSQIVKKSN